MTIQELSDEMRKERARCSTHCPVWNSEDRDCEIYGEQHCPPSKCVFFLKQELTIREEKQKNEKVVHLACKQNKDLKNKLTKAKDIINCLVHLGDFNENTDEEYLNYQVHDVLKQAENFLKE